MEKNDKFTQEEMKKVKNQEEESKFWYLQQILELKETHALEIQNLSCRIAEL